MAVWKNKRKKGILKPEEGIAGKRGGIAKRDKAERWKWMVI
jgi:hypothetical protein